MFSCTILEFSSVSAFGCTYFFMASELLPSELMLGPFQEMLGCEDEDHDG